jgi:hypothetical protein
VTGLNAASIQDKVYSHCARTGVFDTVNGHEVKNAPGKGTHAELFLDTIDPLQVSGLASTSVRLAWKIRISTDMLAEPQDDIDPRIANAADVLFSSLHGDFKLDDDAVDDVRFLDLLGAHGPALAAKAGYISRDSKQYRVMDVTVPVILNDVWSQSA